MQTVYGISLPSIYTIIFLPSFMIVTSLSEIYSSTLVRAIFVYLIICIWSHRASNNLNHQQSKQRTKAMNTSIQQTSLSQQSWQNQPSWQSWQKPTKFFLIVVTTYWDYEQISFKTSTTSDFYWTSFSQMHVYIFIELPLWMYFKKYCHQFQILSDFQYGLEEKVTLVR